MPKVKLYYISYLRVFATLLVVLYHCLCFYTPIWSKDPTVYVNVYIYLTKVFQYIHMPLFFFISGYLFFYFSKLGKYSDLRHFVITKIRRLLIPLFFWSIIVFCFVSTRTLSSFLYNGASHLWFCGSLFIIFFCFGIFRKKWLSSKKKTDLVVWFILLSLSLIIMKFDMPVFLARAVQYAYVFFAGMFFSKYNVVLSKYHLLGFLPLFVLPLIIQQFSGQRVVFSIIGFYNVAALFSVVKENLRYSPDRILIAFFINLVDRHSMGIYLIHHIIIQFLLLNDLFKNLMIDYYYIVPFILFFLVLAVSLIVSFVMNKKLGCFIGG